MAAVAGLVLAATGAALGPVAQSIRTLDGSGETPAGARIEAVMGNGLAVAALGGFRALAADYLWLETYLAWAAGDRPATTTLIGLVTAMDERPEAFWLNGARMIAYDMAQWRLAEAAGRGPVSAAERRRIRGEQAGAALDLLEDARRWHPRSAAICIEMANVELCGRGNVAAAARWYRVAAGLPQAPRFAGRIHAELLRRLGRPAEAYLWLRRLHPTLPKGDPEAMPDVVLARIRALEAELQVTPGKRYTPTEVDGIGQCVQKKN